MADRASFEETKDVVEVADLADLEDEEVPGRERVVELVRVDLEQDRGRVARNSQTSDLIGLHKESSMNLIGCP